MSQVYLIGQTNIGNYEDISINVESNRVNIAVKKAQDLDLKPFMGNAFYNDFIQYFNTDGSIASGAPQPIIDLFNGCEYTDLNGHTIFYEGMEAAIVYWTLARFVEFDNVRFTSTGPVVKKHDDADAAQSKDIARIVAGYRSIANAHANEIEKFLHDNKTNYPLWRYNARNKNSRQPGARIRGIDRTAYNSAGYGYGNYGFGFNGEI